MYASDIKGEAKSFDINLLNSQSLWFEQLFENLCRIYHQQKKISKVTKSIKNTPYRNADNKQTMQRTPWNLYIFPLLSIVSILQRVRKTFFAWFWQFSFMQQIKIMVCINSKILLCSFWLYHAIFFMNQKESQAILGDILIIVSFIFDFSVLQFFSHSYYFDLKQDQITNKIRGIVEYWMD